MIEIYGKENCVHCQNAVKLAVSLEQKYKYYNVQIDGIEALVERMGVRPRTVPQIFVDDNFVGGYKEFYQYMNDKG